MFGLYETAFGALTWGSILMFLIGGLLIYLGIGRKMEPLLLVPIGVGVLLVNLPGGGMMVYQQGLPLEVSTFGEMVHAVMAGKMGFLNVVYAYGIETEVIPLLIFLGVGAMTDFRPAIGRPISFLFGAAAQLGVFVVFFIAYILYSQGYFGTEIDPAKAAASIGIIGGSDGPPTVYLTAALAPKLLGPVTMVAYSYMALVPIIQPPIIKLLTTRKERAIFMKPQIRKVSDLEAILFPIVIFIVAALLVPKSTPLIGMFMFGNLLKASGVTDRLADVASGALINMLTILLGVTVGALMPAEVFLQPQTLAIVVLAVIAFAFSTAGGVLAAKFVNLFLKEKINPMIGAAGVSAIPMAARVVQRMGQQANPRNFLLMHAMGPNMAGAIATSVVAGVFLGMLL